MAPTTVVVERKFLFLAAVFPTLLGPLGMLYTTRLGTLLALLVVLPALAVNVFLGVATWMMLWPLATLVSIGAAVRHNARIYALACAPGVPGGVTIGALRFGSPAPGAPRPARPCAAGRPFGPSFADPASGRRSSRVRAFGGAASGPRTGR